MTQIPFVMSASGVRSPAIIYGTAWKKERTQALVSQAIQAGFRGFDTACQPKHYNEAGVGAGVAACLSAGLNRADLYLQTKFTPVSGQDPRNIPYDLNAAPAEQVAQSFRVSLRNLQTDYLDSLVLHSPLQDDVQMTQVWQAMESIVDSGGARQLGISNCYSLEYLSGLHEWARIKPAVVQNRFYAETGYDREIRAFCKEHGLLYQSFWTLTANPRALAHQAVTALAARYHRTPAQILFRYLTQEGVVPLTGTTSQTHMQEDLAIFELELTADERAAITRLF
jgi:diketogulonate reductase-like aldo/keto reductase